MKNKTNQKGVSIFIAFILVTIFFGIVFGISSILVSQIKLARQTAESVVSFFLAESGIEKTFYYDRKKIPKKEGGAGLEEESDKKKGRGLCNICNTCSSQDCQECYLSRPEHSEEPKDCNPFSCTNCQINFFTEFNGKRYEIEAIALPSGDTIIRAVGSFRQIKRAIELRYKYEQKKD